MKLTIEMIDTIEKWVTLNGLHPQPCGATITSLCQSVGISDETFRRWSQKVEFVEMLNRAREKFAANVEIDVVNALVKAAKGVDYTRQKSEATAQKVIEYDPKTGKKIKEYTTETLVPKKATQENIYFPPSVDAAKFLLTNIAAQRWKLKQEHTIGPESQPLVLNISERAKEGLERALATGAAPRTPENEAEE